MASLYEVEIEPEVRSWLASLSDRDFGRVDFLVISAERSGNCGSTCCASGRGSPTGWHQAGGRYY
jgi:hypothetical protein